MGLINIPDGHFSETFVRMMRARMFVGFYRYGHASELQTKRQYIDIIETAKRHIDEYIKTGNTELLVNIANYMMIEFSYPQHPDAHFEQIEDEDERIGVVTRTVETLLRVDEENSRNLLGERKS